MKSQELAVTSLRPDPADPLGLDLKHILSVLAGKLEGWSWWVRGLDWLGDPGDVFRGSATLVGAGWFYVNSKELVAAADRIYQTVEGDFLAYPRTDHPTELWPEGPSLLDFPRSRAVVAIIAVDGCYFDVYSKDPEVTRLLHEKFNTAREEHVDHYFP